MRQFLDTTDAAKILGMKPQRLAQWRCTGLGPPYHRFGRLVRYTQADLEEWAASQRVAAEG